MSTSLAELVKIVKEGNAKHNGGFFVDPDIVHSLDQIDAVMDAPTIMLLRELWRRCRAWFWRWEK